MKARRQSIRIRYRTAAALAGLARGTLFGFILGLLLSLLAGSWVWLEMRVNVGLLIPGMTIVCLATAAEWGNQFPYRFLVLLQLISIVVFIALYGFDPVALRVVPASFFREGFQAPAMSLDAANIALGVILTAGNACMYVEAYLAGRLSRAVPP
jgi:hypothetical protein